MHPVKPIPEKAAKQNIVEAFKRLSSMTVTIPLVRTLPRAPAANLSGGFNMHEEPHLLQVAVDSTSAQNTCQRVLSQGLTARLCKVNLRAKRCHS